MSEDIARLIEKLQAEMDKRKCDKLSDERVVEALRVLGVIEPTRDQIEQTRFVFGFVMDRESKAYLSGVEDCLNAVRSEQLDDYLRRWYPPLFSPPS